MNGKIIPIITQPHRVLCAKAHDIPIAGIRHARIRNLISNMKATLAITPDGVGLAAPQVGQSLNLFIVSEEAEEIDRVETGRKKRNTPHAEDSNKPPYEKRPWKYYVFINPVVKNKSRKMLDHAEGCLSVPQQYGIVPRHEKFTIEAYDEQGKKIIRGASRFFARVLQHELDHLEGKLFVDKATEFIDVGNPS
ncbi:MAG: peptide deformylase [Candidatus Sungbacteria bacterium]|nr:peptide deformylase [Candidatus Sungbacteria bacterium]